MTDNDFKNKIIEYLANRRDYIIKTHNESGDKDFKKSLAMRFNEIGWMIDFLRDNGLITEEEYEENFVFRKISS